MSEEFTIEKAVAPFGRGRGRKSALRKKIEGLQVGEALTYRPLADVSVSQVYTAAKSAQKATSRVFAVRHVDGCFSIYRTA